MRVWLPFVVGLWALAPSSAADSEGQRETPKTTAFLQTGYSSGSHADGGASIGGTIVTDLGARLALEGSAAYLGRGMGSDAVTASASLHVLLKPRSERTVPYLSVGGGVYRASFDMGNARFRGNRNGGPGTGYGAYGAYGAYGMGMMGGSYTGGSSWNYGQMPMFYGSRMGNLPASMDGAAFGQRSFSDPAISVGGGIRIAVGSQLVLRPDARALVAFSNGESYTVGVFTLSLGYGF